MNVSLGYNSLFFGLAVACFIVAFVAVIFEVANPKVFPGTLSLGLIFGFAGFLGLKFP